MYSILLIAIAVFAATDAVSILPAPIDCSVVLCAFPECDEGEVAITPPGQCCPICEPEDECASVSCPLVRCALGYRSVIPEGECCPRCERDECFGILCAFPDCPNPTVPEGECCPRCEPNCAAVLCLKPVCNAGELLVTPEGECCPECQPNCAAVLCLKPVCNAGELLVTPEGECCPECQPNCSQVHCTLPVCKLGEKVETPEGQCCPICVPDPDGPNCAAVSCVLPKCREGEVPMVPDGECCPVCICEIEGQTFSECGSACPRTCEQPNVVCRAQCRPRCVCEEGFVIDRINKVCTTVDECPDELCPVKGQVQSSCAGCETTCNQVINEEFRNCPAVCREGCTCPGGQVVDTVNNECVDPDECPNPCEGRSCPSGSKCKIYEPTGETFCEPSCSIDNGGCNSSEVCSLQDVQCIRSPCPPIAKCTDPCDECTNEQICRTRAVPCLVPPCPVVADCLELKKVCALSPDPGPCEALIPRYFHNSTSKECEKFIYGGCDGNENNFLSLEECQGKCEDVCSLPSVVGPCDAAIPRYFHNTTSMQCERFVFGGCGGNQNNFESLRECEDECADICSLPPVTGPCRAYFPRYFHNATSGQCEWFVYGGCLGNSNNFRSLSDCVDECGGSPPVSPCALIDCADGFRCEVFGDKGFCRADCSLNNGGCLANQTCSLRPVVCAKAPCFPVRVCEDPPTPPPCPETCSKKFCLYKHPFTPCSNPGPREIPGCTGNCQFSHCGACYVSEEPLAPPPGLDSCPQCLNLSDYTSNTRCYRRWTRCAFRRHRREHGSVNFKYPGDVRCYTPFCPLKG